jgi:hypothetical protein
MNDGQQPQSRPRSGLEKLLPPRRTAYAAQTHHGVRDAATGQLPKRLILIKYKDICQGTGGRIHHRRQLQTIQKLDRFGHGPAMPSIPD